VEYIVKKWYFHLLSVILLLASCNNNSNSPTSTLGSVSGHVYNAYTNEPIAHAQIQTSPASEAVSSGIDGRYTINLTDAGSYMVFAVSGEKYRGFVNVSVYTGKTTQADIYLDTTSVININHAPNIPSNPTPANGASRSSNHLTLRWECSDPDGDVLTYDVYLDKANPPVTKIASDINKNYLDVTSIGDNDVYYWQVVAKDSYLSTKGPVWKIDTLSQDALPTQGLIAYWSFDDGTATDNSGNGNNATLMNNPTVIKGVVGNALRFNGYEGNGSSGSHVILPYINFNNMNEFTISLWGRYEGTLSSDGEYFIFFGDDMASSLGIGNFRAYGGSGIRTAYQVGCVWDTYNEPIPLTVPFQQSDINQWRFYCLVYRNGTMTAYLNGNVIGTKGQNVNVSDTKGGIGRHWWFEGSETATRLNGSVDEVRIYNRALEDAEVQTLSRQ
jgi:hypothetical protein